MHRSISTRSSLIRGAVLLVGCVFLSTLTADAQSGRRSTGHTITVPTVSGPKTVEKKPEPPPVDTRTSLVVAVEEQSPFSGVPFYLSGMVRDTCGDILRKSKLLKTTIASQEMNHGDVVKRAKAETETFVVWLQLGSENYSNDRVNPTFPERLFIRFTIYSPGTAKVKASGYERIAQANKGGIISRIPGSQGNTVYSEYALKEAARSVAERIMDAFRVNVPIGVPGN